MVYRVDQKNGTILIFCK